MFIPDHAFYPSRIPDATTTKGESKKLVFLPFFVATSIKKLKIIFLGWKRNKFEPIYIEPSYFLPKKLSFSSQNRYGF
jgi:hypothetical protein